MNICFLVGKIISDIDFKFVINNYNFSVAMFKIKLENNSIIKVKGYNEIADYCWNKLAKGNIIGIQGYIKQTGEVIIEDI